MCGIAGIAYSNKDHKQEQKLLNIFLRDLKHRGPDGIGMNDGISVKMGMTRLSIIDISGGDQPIYNEDRKIEIVGNGEIYNYLELQYRIIKSGHKLSTRSDIEVPIHLYEDYDMGFVKYLRGMFALAINDIKKERLILIRDRMGEKPIYYYHTKDRLVFASELKTLLKDNSVKCELDPDSINEYFHFNYVVEPNTPFANIKKLEAGNYLIYDLKTGNIIIQRYWDPSKIETTYDLDPVKKLKETFEKSCSISLRSDVEVGLSLSGGLDSSAILAFSAPKYKQVMKSFTIGYKERPPSDERLMARFLSEKFGVNSIQLEVSTKDFVNDFPSLVYWSDDLIADIAAYSIYSVSKLANSKKVKVLLGGIGGDELFWGYDWVRNVTRENFKFLKSKKTHKYVFYDENSVFKSAEEYINPKIYTTQFINQINPDRIREDNSTSGKLTTEIDIARFGMDLIRDKWLLSNCIDLTERLSMANSVELRSPFLDYKLVELAYSSRKNVLAYKLSHKYWLKKMLKGTLPDFFIDLPKTGFTPPTVEWLRSIIGRYFRLLLNGYLVQNKIVTRSGLIGLGFLWHKHADLRQVIYRLLVLEIWCREYIWNQTPDEIYRAKL